MTITKTSVFVILLILAGCSLKSSPPTALRSITVLYTNDEHGWMEGMDADRGAASLLRQWQEQEGYYGKAEDFLLLSGGDNWTGPAISTWSQGQSMVEVMNTMGYDASAVGNHEFDFGLDVLRQRTSEADFPYLSANTLWRHSGEVATDLGLLPFTVSEINDLQVGIIGLTTRDTPVSTNPLTVAGLRFQDYEAALRRTLPEIREEELDLLFVISHVCIDELEALIHRVEDLAIDLFGAGHCNELEARQIGESMLIGGGYHFTAYAWARFSYDIEREILVNSSSGVNDHEPGPGNARVAGLVDSWRQQIAADLDRVIAYSARAEPRSEGRLGRAIAESWLWSDPGADVAITNAGGIRIDLQAGPITLGTVVAMMPFDNTIVALNLDAAAIANVLESGSRPVVAGLERRQGQWYLSRTGQPLSQDRHYRVLVNSFMYAGGDNYQSLANADPDAVDTGIHYRQPFQDWLQQLHTSAADPLLLQ